MSSSGNPRAGKKWIFGQDSWCLGCLDSVGRQARMVEVLEEISICLLEGPSKGPPTGISNNRVYILTVLGAKI